QSTLYLPSSHSFPTRRSSDLFMPDIPNPFSPYWFPDWYNNLSAAQKASFVLPDGQTPSPESPLTIPLRFSDGGTGTLTVTGVGRSEEHTSELQSRVDLVCRLL